MYIRPRPRPRLAVEVAPRQYCPALHCTALGGVLPPCTALHSAATYLNPMHGHYISGINCDVASATGDVPGKC